MGFWLNLYSDPEVRRQMYSPVLGSEESLWNYLRQKGKSYTVWDQATRVGGFTLVNVAPHIGSFGVVIDKNHRGQHYGAKVMHLLEREAWRLGYRTLRADVYEDNGSCLRLLENCAYRKFVWLEKNL